MLVKGATGSPFTNMFNIYPDMDKYLHPLWSVRWKHLSNGVAEGGFVNG